MCTDLLRLHNPIQYNPIKSNQNDSSEMNWNCYDWWIHLDRVSKSAQIVCLNSNFGTFWPTN